MNSLIGTFLNFPRNLSRNLGERITTKPLKGFFLNKSVFAKMISVNHVHSIDGTDKAQGVDVGHLDSLFADIVGACCLPKLIINRNFEVMNDREFNLESSTRFKGVYYRLAFRDHDVDNINNNNNNNDAELAWWEQVDLEYPLHLQKSTMPGRGNPYEKKQQGQNEQHRASRADMDSDFTSTEETLPDGTKKKRRTTAQKNAAKKARQQQQQQNQREGYPLRSGKGGPPPRPPPESGTTTPRPSPREETATRPEQLAPAIASTSAAQASSPSPHGTGSANLAGALARLDEFNPTLAMPPKSKKNDRTPDDRTFEITYYDGSALFDDFQYAAKMLRTAKAIRDEGLEDKDKLKINTRSLKCGDWIVLADDEMTKEWLANYFANSVQFRSQYRATLMSERGRQIKYTVRVQPPESRDEAPAILTSLFAKVGYFGYVRVVSESRFYNDERIRNAYHKALKKRALNKFSDEGKPYVKTIWLRMTVDASNCLVENWSELSLYYGINRLEVEMAPERLQERPNRQDASSSNNNNPANSGTDARDEDEDLESAADVVSVMDEDTEDNSNPNENDPNKDKNKTDQENDKSGGSDTEEAQAKDSERISE